MSETNPFMTGDRVQVKWLETGDLFFARIINIVVNQVDFVSNPSSQFIFDVEYEEKIQGKTCTERNIAMDRIVRCTKAAGGELLSDNKSRPSVIERLTNDDIETEGGDITEALSLNDLMELLDFVSAHHGDEFITKDKLEVLMSRISPILMDDVSTDFGKYFDQNFSDMSAKDWIITDGVEMVTSMKRVFSSSSILLNCLINSKIASTAVISGESVESGLRSIIRFITNSLSIKPEATTTVAPSSNIPVESTKKKASKSSKSHTEYHLVNELIKSFSPLTVLVTDTMAQLLLTIKQDERVCFSSQELSLCILSIDAGQGFDSSALVAIHRSAIRLITSLATRYPHIRHALIMEIIPLLSTAYSAKSPVRILGLWSYPSSHLVSSSRTICSAFGALLAILQAKPASDISNNLSSTTTIDSSTSNISNKNNISMQDIMASLLDSKQLCGVFASELLKRCGHKEVFASYRLTALRLIEDLFIVLICPEYPVANILLESILRFFVGQMNVIITNQSAKRDVAYMNFILDLLGACGGSIRTLTLNTKREADIISSYTFSNQFLEKLESKLTNLRSDWFQNGLTIPTTGSETTNQNSESSSGSGKKKKRKSTCISISSALTIHQNVCSAALDCTIEENKYFDSSTNIIIPPSLLLLSACPGNEDIIKMFPSLSEIDVLNYFISEYLRLHLNHSIDSMTVHSAFILSLQNWANESHDKGREEVCQHAINILSSYCLKISSSHFNLSNMSNNSCLVKVEIIESSLIKEEKLKECFSSEWIRKTVRNLLSARNLDAFFDTILTTILLTFAEGSPLIRARAVKTIAHLLRSDPELFEHTEVRETMNERLFDAAICVREEVVKLIGGFVFQGIDVSDKFLDSLLSRLEDSGVSVRKAVVNILKGILINQPKHHRYSDICLRLLQMSSLPKEEDTVRELITLSFQQLWFLPPPDSVMALTVRPVKPARASFASPVKESDSVKDLIGLGWKISDVCKSIDYGAEGGGQKVRRTHSAESNISDAQRRNSFLYLSPDGFSCTSLDEAMSYAINGADTTGLVNVNSNVFEETKGDNFEDVNFLVSVINPNNDIVDIVSTSSLRFDENIKDTASQIVSVANSLEDSSWIVNVIRETLYSKAQGAGTPAIVQRRRQLSLIHCGKIVNCLIDMLIRCEEELAVLDPKQPEVKETLYSKLVSILLSISIFCKAHPHFLLPYVQQMLPYLKGDNNMGYSNECLISLNITEMLEAASIVQGFTIGSRANDVCDDLVRIAFRFSNLNIDAAVSCMAAIIINVSHDTLPLLKLGDRCFKTIQQAALTFNSSKNMSKEQAARLQRCLIVLGYVCEHSRKCAALLFDTLLVSDPYVESVANTSIIAQDNFTAESMHGICYSAVLFCLSLPDSMLHIRATQTLCSIFTGYPKLMLLANTSGLLSKLFSPKQSYEVHFTLLKSLTTMMMSEEKRLESTSLAASMVEAGEKVKGNVHAPTESDSDFTPAGFVLQDYLPIFIAFLYHKKTEIRSSSLQLIGTLLRQGMLCPLDTISPLIALQGDNDFMIRTSSLKILELEVQKHPNFFDNRLLEGIESTYENQMKMTGTSNPSDEDGNSIFKAMYSSCIVTDRRRRGDFIIGLLKKCLSFCLDYNDSSADSIKSPTLEKAFEATEHLDRVRFFTITLTLLPYEYADEALLLVNWIGRQVSIVSTILTSRMKAHLYLLGSRERTEGGMQAPAEGRKLKLNSASKITTGDDGLIFDIEQLKSCSIISSELQNLIAKVTLGTVATRTIECILRLKMHIKFIYGLSEEKCLSFSPDDKVNYEKIKQAEFFEPFEPWPKNTLPFPAVEKTKMEAESISSIVRFFTADYNRYQTVVDNDADDFQIISKKKAAKAAKRIDSANKVKKIDPEGALKKIKIKSPASKKKAQKKRSYKKMNETESEGDEEDADSESDYHASE